MAVRNVRIPGVRERFVMEDGTVNPVWHKFLIDLYERTGGGDTDKVDAATSTANSAIGSIGTIEAGIDQINFMDEFGIL